ncbi:flagellar hook-basal body complex protein [Oceanicola sp. S124]|uniref:flagellar hook-basal body complex protein n=1 Tax=Oceanicola sp. S124 TaxID=1042378 RepID=UPI0002558D61|nr:flagellar hook-basal body complex protein [Oceanicola sp. S124]
MESTGYTTLTRLSGLAREMDVIANNIANASTTGFRTEEMIFSEYIQGVDDGPSISMAQGNIRWIDYAQGTLSPTGGSLDFAIEGEGFFLVQTPQGERLTRAGSFATSNAGDLVTNDGYPVLDAGGAPIFIPPATDISVAGDGTISANGAPIGQIGVVLPAEPDRMQRQGGTMFVAEAGFDAAEAPRVLQGFLEASNVSPVAEISRMITVQRAYELGQSFLEREDERVRNLLKTLA